MNFRRGREEGVLAKPLSNAKVLVKKGVILSILRVLASWREHFPPPLLNRVRHCLNFNVANDQGYFAIEVAAGPSFTAGQV